MYIPEYMRHDPHLSRFMGFFYLYLPTFMIVPVDSRDNIIQMFVWRGGVGFVLFTYKFQFTRLVGTIKQ
jgi:NADH:ubiquinone oxidoreductase subunit 5 (subunit L)/multisubunit Na+/H+ antiporter MnhA subunit